MITGGSAAHPVQLDHYQLIVGIGWGGGEGAAVVEIEASELNSYQVRSVTPDDPDGTLIEFFAGAEVKVDDYKEKYILEFDLFETGTIVAEYAITDNHIWDGYYVGQLGDDAVNHANVDNGNRMFGYPANVHLVGEQIRWDFTTFGRATLGDYVTITQPNGSRYTYSNGYTAISHGPAIDRNGQPIGDFPFTSSEEWAWYHLHTIPEVTVRVLRYSFLTNFKSDKVRIAQIWNNIGSELDYPVKYSLKIYPWGTGFKIADGRLTALPAPDGKPISPTFSAEATAPSIQNGEIRRFNSAGWV